MVHITSIRLLILGTMIATLVGRTPALSAAPLPLFSVTSGSTMPAGINGLGYDFTTTQPLLISALGTFDANGNDIATNGGGSEMVALYENSGPGAGTLLVSGAVTSTDPATSLAGATYTSGDAFRYDTLATPYILPPGDYRILTENNSIAVQFIPHPGYATAFGFTMNESVVDFGSFGYSATVIAGNNPGDVGPNLLVSVVPEPSSVVLGTLAAAGLMLAARHRRKR